jgi:hypothetical protein
MSEKQCTICQQIKPVTEFYKHYNKKPGWTLAHCKKCNYEKYQRPTAIKRLEKQGKKPKVQFTLEEKVIKQKNRLKKYASSDKGKEARRRYLNKKKANKAVTVKVNKPQKIKTLEQIEQIKQRKKEWRRAYHLKTYIKKARVDKDQTFKKLKKSLRRRFKKALDGNKTEGKAVTYLGCTVPELKNYLNSMFQLGMSWDNYGDWHIDHIKPLCSFDLTSEEEIKKACHYTNLRPLWAKDNIEKSKEDVKLKFVTVEPKINL